MSISHILEAIEKARESYKLPPPKFLITQREYDWLVSIYPGSGDVKAFMDEHYTVVMPLEAADAYINEKLRDGYLERLGSLASEQGRRVAPNPEVPGLRGLGHSTYQTYFDEPCYTEENVCRWRDGTSAEKWLEHRVFCKRDVLACLSRKES